MVLVRTEPALMMHITNGYVNTKEELENEFDFESLKEFEEDGCTEEEVMEKYWDSFIYVVWDTERQNWVEDK